MNKYFHFLFLTCLLNAPLVYGQYANNFEKAVLAALDSSHFYTYDDFFGAGPYDSLTIKDQFQFAEAARRMGAYGIAESAYARAVQLDSLRKRNIFQKPDTGKEKCTKYKATIKKPCIILSNS